MTLESIYYIGQTLAVIAILCSLIFLAVQTRLQIRIARAELARETDRHWGVFLHAVRDDEEFSRLVRVGIQHWDQLSNNQRFRLNASWLELPMALASAPLLREAGLIKPWQESMQVNFLLSLLQTPGGRAWWGGAKFAIPKHVRERLDAHLSSGEDLPPPWDEFLPFKATEEDLAIIRARDRAALSSGKPEKEPTKPNDE